jgi:hypothetical protein
MSLKKDTPDIKENIQTPWREPLYFSRSFRRAWKKFYDGLPGNAR